jgi:hypothetical protein
MSPGFRFNRCTSEGGTFNRFLSETGNAAPLGEPRWKVRSNDPHMQLASYTHQRTKGQANKLAADDPLPSDKTGGTGTPSMTFPDTTATHHTKRGHSPAPSGVHADVRTGGPLEESRDSTPQECCARGKSDPVAPTGAEPEAEMGALGSSHPRRRWKKRVLEHPPKRTAGCDPANASLPGVGGEGVDYFAHPPILDPRTSAQLYRQITIY